MSIHIDALRDIAANHGWSVCDEAADEIEDLERAYALLFAENAKLRAQVDALTGPRACPPMPPAVSTYYDDIDKEEVACYSAIQMHAFVEADRVARGAA
jgi:hypothetical protein